MHTTPYRTTTASTATHTETSMHSMPEPDCITHLLSEASASLTALNENGVLPPRAAKQAIITRTRNRKNRDMTCSLCDFGPHLLNPVQPADATCRIKPQGDNAALVSTNVPGLAFSVFDRFRENHSLPARITLLADKAVGMNHVIPLENGSVPVVDYGTDGEFFTIEYRHRLIDIPLTRQPKGTTFEIRSEQPDWLTRPTTGPGQPVGIPRTAGSLHMTAWHPWETMQKALKQELRLPGIYLVAMFNDQPETVSKIPREMVYAGMTTATLRTRLRQFEVSATRHRHGHSGGREFARLIVSPETRRFPQYPMPAEACVAVIPVPFAPGVIPKARKAYLEWLESTIIREYRATWGDAPRCNRVE